MLMNELIDRYVVTFQKKRY